MEKETKLSSWTLANVYGAKDHIDGYIALAVALGLLRDGFPNVGGAIARITKILDNSSDSSRLDKKHKHWLEGLKHDWALAQLQKHKSLPETAALTQQARKHFSSFAPLTNLKAMFHCSQVHQSHPALVRRGIGPWSGRRVLSHWRGAHRPFFRPSIFVSS